MNQQIRFCTSRDGTRIAYAVSGDGPPLVQAAHWLSHLDFAWNSPVWRHWLAELSKEHTLIRYDKRGCGLSDWDVDDFSLDAQVQDLEAVVEATGVDRFPLLAISGGGPIAICYAARYPERVTCLVLYGCYAQGRKVRASTPQDHARARVLLDSMRAGWGQSNPAFRQIYTSLFIPEGTPEQIEWFNELQQISTTPEISMRMSEASFGIDVTGLASQISVPTLILHTKDEAVIPFEQSRRLAGLIPGARFVPLDGRNHILLKDEPAWTRFLSVFRDFLRTSDRAGSDGQNWARDTGHDRARRPSRAEEIFAELTAREREVLDLIARGYRNEQIAERLFITPKTVRNHVTRIYSKLDVDGRPQAIIVAREAGFAR